MIFDYYIYNLVYQILVIVFISFEIMTTESEPTLKDLSSLSDIKTSLQNINGRLTKLDTSIENVNVRLNKLEALDFKIAQVEESQDFNQRNMKPKKQL